MRKGETGDIRDVVEKFFQGKEGKVVRFVIDGKTIRDGVFGGIEIETFHAKVFIDDSRIKERYYELPYPFHVETNESKGEIFLDYRTNSIATIQENQNLVNTLINETGGRNRLLNKILEVRFA